MDKSKFKHIKPALIYSSIGVICVILMIYLTASFIGSFDVKKPVKEESVSDRFSFKSFEERDLKVDAFKFLFPIGIEKELVDQVLINEGGANVSEVLKLKGAYRYSEPLELEGEEGISHLFIFDEQDKLINIQFEKNEYLYEDQPTLKELRKQLKEKSKE